jgi:uncharacterized protein (DUF1501 family)
MNRRTFLARAGAAASALALGGLGPRLVRGAEGSDRYYVFAYFEGGWDSLLGLDPRDPTVFTDALAPTTGIQPAYDRIGPELPHAPVDAGPFELGPCCVTLAPYADTFSVVRGINMATLTHEVGRRYFITGQSPSGLQARGPSVASLATAQLGADRPIPHLASGVEAYNDVLPPFAAAMPVTFVSQLQYILQDHLGLPKTGVSAGAEAALASYRARALDHGPGAGAGATPLAAIYLDNRERAAELVASGLHASFDFAGPKTAALREHFGLSAQTIESAYGRAALAAQALETGLSRVVSVALSTGLDTHDQSWSFQHPGALFQGFDALARLIDRLAQAEAPSGGALLDKTTFIAFSEFQRTPRLNTRGGRDHHLGNCALIGGAGIRSGQVFGASSDQAMEPELASLDTGAASPDGETVRPEHVLATALAAGDLDPSDLRVPGLAPLLA